MLKVKVSSKYDNVVEYIKNKSSAKSISGVFKNALGAYLWILSHLSSGHKIVAITEKGSSEFPDPREELEDFD